MFKPTDLFDLTQTEHTALFDGCEFAWDALKKLKAFIEARAKDTPTHAFGPHVFIGKNVLIGEGTVIEDGAMIKGPAIIGRNCEIRHGAYIRDHVIVGDGCVIGNSSELKHSFLFNGCQVPHFN
ncbi:MAG: UDP-N-acetylglucosamine diphosphorylase, partial [Verrucomicrobia bacterium]|nr:UDP-N-acetylglucosamine diphosphorylase [Verrucomicrobiota bacterium]